MPIKLMLSVPVYNKTNPILFTGLIGKQRNGYLYVARDTGHSHNIPFDCGTSHKAIDQQHNSYVYVALN